MDLFDQNEIRFNCFKLNVISSRIKLRLKVNGAENLEKLQLIYFIIFENLKWDLTLTLY